ncbi:hypothetical protein GFS31_05590 [Leptolyngbya sp. BL0902]|uniref:hypothetical protein n=1 Tax=Leptolyngbya sp. BL0902 TaxID=1115757 RepID=UPI0018E77BD7|nr:hypothetical protein [Leptolyngbya sp. BL0902]QQE63888.1 hypothetical protein GFS31_05590 [Leptolyngbya sp. BL0902]
MIKNEHSQSSPDQPFQPHQIVYLTCDQSRLYTEVIEVLTDRQLAWVRPLVLSTPKETLPLAAASALGWEQGAGHDAPAVPDLIWPLAQFTPALDTDFLALLTTISPPTAGAVRRDQGAVVSQFIRRLWGTRAVSPPPA